MMSLKVMSWVWDQRGLTSARKLMLMALADRSDDRGEGVFMGLSRLAWKVDVDVRTAQRTISNLADAGFIHVEYHGGIRTKSGQRTNLYTIIAYKRDVLGEDISRYLAMARGDKNVTPCENEGVTKTPPLAPTKTSPLEPEGVTKTSPNPLVKESYVSNHTSDQSKNDDDDENLDSTGQEKIVKEFFGDDAGLLVEKYGLDEMTHAWRYVGEREIIRKARQYAISMLRGERPMAALKKNVPAEKSLGDYDGSEFLAERVASAEKVDAEILACTTEDARVSWQVAVDQISHQYPVVPQLSKIRLIRCNENSHYVEVDLFVLRQQPRLLELLALTYWRVARPDEPVCAVFFNGDLEYEVTCDG